MEGSGAALPQQEALLGSLLPHFWATTRDLLPSIWASFFVNINRSALCSPAPSGATCVGLWLSSGDSFPAEATIHNRTVLLLLPNTPTLSPKTELPLSSVPLWHTFPF